MAWYFGVLAHNTQFETGPGTADLTITVIHSYKLPINGVKPIHVFTPQCGHEK